MENKITEVEILNSIKEKCADDEVIVAYCDKVLVAKAAKAEKAKVRAAAKKAEGDELRGIVASVLTKEPMIAEDILAAIGDEELTKNKVISRLTQLCKAGDAVKTEVTINGKRRMAYSIAD